MASRKNVYDRKTITEQIQLLDNLRGMSLEDLKILAMRLEMEHGKDSLLHIEYDDWDNGFTFYVDVFRQETDFEYNARIEAWKLREGRRKTYLENKKKKDQEAAKKAEEEEKALFEKLKKKYLGEL